jgi:hypothetical protein
MQEMALAVPKILPLTDSNCAALSHGLPAFGRRLWQAL